MHPLGAPVQIAYTVPDAVAAAEWWARSIGAGPFFVNEHIELVDVVHRGRPARFDHTSAYGQWGSVMVELVQDHGAGPSVVRERFGVGETGLHHLAFIVDDLQESLTCLRADGHEVAMSARTAGGTAFHFVDLGPSLGHFAEIYEDGERLRSFYAMVATAADGWDGRDPVRSI